MNPLEWYSAYDKTRLSHYRGELVVNIDKEKKHVLTNKVHTDNHQ